MKTEAFVITLDGPAGVGKTTLAKNLAEDLKIAFLDTGAMYRAAALLLGKEVHTWSDGKLREGLKAIEFSMKDTGRSSLLYVNGRPVGDEIRTEEVGMEASNIAKLPLVREVLMQAQREVGKTISLVAEGRDMGTVVFPDAAYKFYIDADPAVRAKRRHDQLIDAAKPSDLAALEAEMRERDAQDMNRAIAPLKPAEDAVVVDTSKLSAEQVLAFVREYIESKA
jgi:cytidylate kinase